MRRGSARLHCPLQPTSRGRAAGGVALQSFPLSRQGDVRGFLDVDHSEHSHLGRVLGSPAFFWKEHGIEMWSKKQTAAHMNTTYMRRGPHAGCLGCMEQCHSARGIQNVISFFFSF